MKCDVLLLVTYSCYYPGDRDIEMNQPNCSPNAEAQRRFRERRKSERDWLRNALLKSQVEIARLKVAQTEKVEEKAVV